jgi:hypothetical protein
MVVRSASGSRDVGVEPLAERWVRLTFGDGAVHEVDPAGLFAAGGVFAAIRDDREIFEASRSTRSSARSYGWATSILIPTCSAETNRRHPDELCPNESFSQPDERRPTHASPCAPRELRLLPAPARLLLFFVRLRRAHANSGWPGAALQHRPQLGAGRVESPFVGLSAAFG